MKNTRRLFIVLMSGLWLLAACQSAPDPAPFEVIDTPLEAPATTPAPQQGELANQEREAGKDEDKNPTPPPSITPSENVVTPTITPTFTPLPPPETTLTEDIRFETGATSGSVTNNIDNNTLHVYTFYAFEGQPISVRLLTEAEGIWFKVQPKSTRISLPSATGSTTTTYWNGVLPDTGNYEIVVGALNGSGPYEVVLEILPLEAESGIPEGFVLDKSAVVGDFTAEIYVNPEAMFESLGIIRRGNEILERIDYVRDFDGANGSDVTGDGAAELILNLYTGGAHCCSSTLAYATNAGTLTPILESRPSNCGGAFQDIEQDGVFEWVTCDDIFAYTYCAYAFSPTVRVVYAFDGSQYVPASPQYADTYTEDITFSEQRLRSAGEDGLDFDGGNRCAILPLIMVYLYTGQPDLAWETVDTNYAGADKYFFWADLLQVVESSGLYVPAGELPTVDFPPYYQLDVSHGCGTFPPTLLLMEAGEINCGVGTTLTDLFWLTLELGQAGYLPEFVQGTVLPEGCTEGCEIRLTTFEENTQVAVGTLRFNTDSFPGYVEYLDTSGSSLWKLRLTGDLTWEEVE